MLFVYLTFCSISERESSSSIILLCKSQVPPSGPVTFMSEPLISVTDTDIHIISYHVVQHQPPTQALQSVVRDGPLDFYGGGWRNWSSSTFFFYTNLQAKIFFLHQPADQLFFFTSMWFQFFFFYAYFVLYCGASGHCEQHKYLNLVL